MLRCASQYRCYERCTIGISWNVVLFARWLDYGRRVHDASASRCVSSATCRPLQWFVFALLHLRMDAMIDPLPSRVHTRRFVGIAQPSDSDSDLWHRCTGHYTLHSGRFLGRLVLRRCVVALHRSIWRL